MAKSAVGIQGGLLGAIQRFGNLLPNPFMLFVSLAILVLAISYICAHFGVAITTGVIDKSTGALVQKTVAVKNLLTVEYLREFLINFTKTYISFPPLGLVMVTMIGIGYVQATGFFEVAMKNICKAVPPYMVTFSIILMACVADVASNAGIVVSTTLAAALFASIGRNPIVGAVVGYAVAHGAEPTNVLLTGFMVTISSITQAAVDSAHIQADITPLSNYYFLAVSCILLSIILTFVTEKILPRYVEMYRKPEQTFQDDPNDPEVIYHEKLARLKENNALFTTFIWFGFYVFFIFAGVAPKDGVLRTAAGELIPKSPFINGIIPILVGAFLVIGTTFGLCNGKIKSQHDIPKLMTAGIKDAALYFVICFPAAYFIKFFSDSNLTIVLSGLGAAWLQSIQMPTLVLLLTFILQVMFLNLFVTSGSAKWLVLAPIFVPMFHAVGISPALSQLCYVISDTITDPVAICNYYIPIVIAVMEKYKQPGETIGIGNVLSMTAPYSIAIGITLISLLCLWYGMDWMIGPGAPIR